MEKEKNHLSLLERQTLYSMLEAGKSFRFIGRELRRSASTIQREYNRNKAARHLWRAMSGLEKARYAQERKSERQSKKARLNRHLLDSRPDACRKILTLLEETNYSPEAIASILSQSDLGISISGKTIRRWVKRMYPTFQKYFPHRGKRPRTNLTPRTRRKRQREAAPAMRSVHQRQCARNEVGNFELDLVVSSQSRTVILAVRDRKTRKIWLRLVENREATPVRQAIVKVLSDIPPLMRRSCTFDRGGEFAEVHPIEKLYAITNYFCDAYCAWQKGSVEQGNKELRRYVQKKTDLALVSKERLLRIEKLLNTKPRKTLGGLSSDDLWIMEARKIYNLMH
jgi:IS30 family transposase